MLNQHIISDRARDSRMQLSSLYDLDMMPVLSDEKCILYVETDQLCDKLSTSDVFILPTVSIALCSSSLSLHFRRVLFVWFAGRL